MVTQATSATRFSKMGGSSPSTSSCASTSPSRPTRCASAFLRSEKAVSSWTPSIQLVAWSTVDTWQFHLFLSWELWLIGHSPRRHWTLSSGLNWPRSRQICTSPSAWTRTIWRGIWGHASKSGRRSSLALDSFFSFCSCSLDPSYCSVHSIRLLRLIIRQVARSRQPFRTRILWKGRIRLYPSSRHSKWLRSSRWTRLSTTL